MDQLERYQCHGYMRDVEQRMREIALMSPNERSLASEAANQIKHLKDSLADLIAAVEKLNGIAELVDVEKAKEALNA